MRKTFYAVLLTIFSCSFGYADSVTIVQGNSDAVYEVGDQATFFIMYGADDPNSELDVFEMETPLEWPVTVTFTNDNGELVLQTDGTVMDGAPMICTATLQKPGFLRCNAEIKKDTQSLYATSAAAFSPELIQPARDTVEDFDAFWDQALKDLAAVPGNFQKTHIPELSNTTRDVYLVRDTNINEQMIGGLLVIPKGEGPFPAVVAFPGAGPGFDAQAIDWNYRPGVITLAANVFPYPTKVSLPDPDPEYIALNKERPYYLQGAPDKNRYFYRAAITGLYRLLDDVTTLPQWDGKNLALIGHSQGGAMAIALGALHPATSCVVSWEPALSDHFGGQEGRQAGWPQVLANVSEADRKNYEAMLGYFDVVNFARKLKVPTVMAVGFIDSTCSPSSVYAVYNVIDAPKKMWNCPGYGHWISSEAHDNSRDWMHRMISGEAEEKETSKTN